MKTNWSSLSRNGSLALTRPGTLVQCNTAAPWVAGGGEKQIEGFCAPMTFCNHFFSLGLQTYTSFSWFLSSRVQFAKSRTESVCRCGIEQISHIGFTSEETSTKG